MKKLTILVMVIAMISTVVITSHADEYKLSDDPRLSEARKSFDDGMKHMKRGESDLRRRAGQAQKSFEHAEDYFTKAAYQYKELGETLGIDTTKEITLCNEMDRKVHVMVNKARKRGARAGGMQRH